MDRAATVLGRLDALRVELADLAYLLERRGRRDAADLAVAVSARLGEIHDELAAGPADPDRSPASVRHPALSDA
ncbi:MAG: hypothetical protein JNL92_07120 [Opitutaceae bacterium]|nr:hypothetical protein [Opitutaceae bacterium]